MSDDLNLGADWEQSKRLVAHWHKMWAEAKIELKENLEEWSECVKRETQCRTDWLEAMAKLEEFHAALYSIVWITGDARNWTSQEGDFGKPKIDTCVIDRTLVEKALSK